MAEGIVTKGMLVVRANGEMRVVKKAVRLRLDEVAFPIEVTIPNQWGQVQRTKIEVELPEPPAARVTVGEPQIEDE